MFDMLLLVAATATAAPPDAAGILARADRVRASWEEAVIRLRATVPGKAGEPASAEFEVAVKGQSSVIRFQGADAGKVFLSVGSDAWLILPTARNPIKVPKSHRLRGGFGAADVAATRFSEAYDAVVERSDELDGRTCDVLRLTEKKGMHPSYPVLRVWVDRKEGLYRKTVFLLPSGKTAKEATFDSYKPYRGVLSVERMTVVDALKPGKTVIEYLDYEKKQLPDALFDAKTYLKTPNPSPSARKSP